MLDAAVDPDGRPVAEVRRLAFLNASFETGIENPLDTGIVAAGERDRLGTEGYRKIDEIPYDFIRKRLTIVVKAMDDPAHASDHHQRRVRQRAGSVLDVDA